MSPDTSIITTTSMQYEIEYYTRALSLERRTSNNTTKQIHLVKQLLTLTTERGRDLSILFCDVLQCIRTEDVELKGLVYQYILHNAHAVPEMVFLATSSIIQVLN